MNVEHRKILKIHRDYLIEKVSFHDVKSYLLEYKLFNKYMWEDIKSMSDVLDFLPFRGPKAFQNWIEILRKAGYNKEASDLEITPEEILPGKTKDDNSYYRMSSELLGHCLIINNIDFQATGDSKRIHGTEVDAKSLRDFFKSAEYGVTVEENLTAEEIKSCLEKFAQKDFKSVDSMVLVILSYGDPSTVYGADGKPVSKKIICDYFNNRNCLGLQNKPKMFFFVSFGGKEAVVSFGSPKTFPKESTDAESYSLMPTRSDIFLFHLIFPNEYRELDSDKGSSFCQVLMSVLDEFYLKYDLETMMEVFNKRLKEKIPVAVALSENFGLRKKIMLSRMK